MSETSQTKNIEYDAVGRVKKETRRMANEKFEISEIIMDNVGAVDTFSYSLKKIVNAKATPEMIERLQGLDLLFGVK